MSKKKATRILTKKLGRAPDAAEVKAYIIKMAKKKRRKEKKKRKEKQMQPLPAPPARPDSDSDADGDADYELPLEPGHAHEAPEYAVTGSDAATYGSVETVSNGVEEDFTDSDGDSDTDDGEIDF